MEIELARATSVTVGVRRALGLALLGASLAGCRQEVTATTAGPLEVPVVVLRPETIPIYAELIGSVDGAENAEIRARVPGYLQEQHYKEGTTVKKGTLLFTIDPVLSQAAVRQVSGEVETAKAALARATADVERLKPLAASSAVRPRRNSVWSSTTNTRIGGAVTMPRPVPAPGPGGRPRRLPAARGSPSCPDRGPRRASGWRPAVRRAPS